MTFPVYNRLARSCALLVVAIPLRDGLQLAGFKAKRFADREDFTYEEFVLSQLQQFVSAAEVDELIDRSASLLLLSQPMK
jgi:hypothetical protein